MLNLLHGAGRQRILEVGSIHLRLKAPVERRRIRKAEEELYNGLRFPIQRIALPVPLDLSEYLEGLYEHAGADKSKSRACLLLDKANHVAGLIHERHLVQWRNLVVVPIEEDRTAGERVHYVRSGLERLGLSVRELTDDEAAQVWYEILSPECAAIDRIRTGRAEHTSTESAPRCWTSDGASASRWGTSCAGCWW